MKVNIQKAVICFSSLFVSFMTFSEDIELYISNAVKQASDKTQVLIIFDNSGSMGTKEWVTPSYDPSTKYPAVNGNTKFSSEYIYYNKGDSVAIPDDPNEKRRFLASINGCESAKSTLATTGHYTGHIRRYKFSGNTGEWKNIPRYSGASIFVLDCEDDVVNKKSNNASGLPVGFPVNYKGDASNPQYYTTNVGDSDVSWSGALITLYSENYLRWYHSSAATPVQKTRMEMAKESITNVINSAPSIDFGLQIFNLNDGDSSNHPNGGRVAFGINEMTTTNKAKFLSLVKNDLTPETWTPLCETLYEASLYFSGKKVGFGNDDVTRHYYDRYGRYTGSYNKNTPPMDPTVQNGNGEYITPLKNCNSKAYVILITDGAPTNDNGADNAIESLSVVEDGKTVKFNGSKVSGNYLAGLAQWMSEHDVNDKLDGKQTIDTYTIGFSSGANAAAPLLTETAKLGNGKYFKAQDSVQLTTALLNALEDLEPSNDSLTSASVAANNFDRTETLNSVYYAMFDPQNGPRWQGNLKKYKVIKGKQVGQAGKLALNGNTGHFSDDVTSFWSDANSKDGDVVAEGGVADMLRKVTKRKLYSDLTVAGTSLVPYTRANAEIAYTNAAGLAAKLGVAEADIDSTLNWHAGLDVDDEDKDKSVIDYRHDVFGDPLHSKPLVVNYGNSIRILIGTNAGVLHMFEDNTKTDVVSETWAFLPKEFFPNIKPLRDNFSATKKLYGIDGQISHYIKDYNGDGIVNGADKVYIYFGLRRGGSSYYALDITSPTKPELLWKIDQNTPKFGELGQSWSKPKIAFSELNITGSGANAVAEPVVIFSGGYDPAKDKTGPGGNDSSGRAIYMVDAKTGVLKWSITPSGGTTNFTGITDSIASSIGTLDSDGNGLVDRLYAGDTGGNVWRIDMPSANPKDTKEPWTVFKLASLGGTTNDTDRRFFNEPSIVRTFITETLETVVTDASGNSKKVISKQEKPYDAILIGSGDRTNPLGKDTQDMFFMIKDENIRTQSFSSSSKPSTPTNIQLSELADYTANPFGQSLTDAARETLEIAVSKKKGWYLKFGKSVGEKNSSLGIVIQNVAYFTSFSPPPLVPNVVICELPNGKGWLYAIDLAKGTSIYNWVDSENPNGIKDGDERKVYISEQFLGAPTLIVTDDGDASTVDGNIIVGRKIIPVGFSLKTLRTHLYIEEN